MPIFDRNGREVIRILDNQGREIETVYDQNGVIVYTNATTIIGTSPMQFKALGLPLKDYRIYGETLQDGSPSPEAPVNAVGCGVRTANLFDKDNVLENYYLKDGAPTSINVGGYVLSDYIPIVSNTATISAKVTAASPTGSHWAVYDENKTFIRGGLTFDAQLAGNKAKVMDTSGAAFIRVDYASKFITDCMLNLGSTALPYEPYGYKLPVTTTNGTDTVSTPIYIGSEPLHRIGENADYVDYSSGKIVRKIKKIIIHNDGVLEFGRARLNTPDIARIDIIIEKYGKAIYFPEVSVSDTIPRTCSHLMRGAFSSNNGEVIGSYSNYLLVPTLFLSTIDATGEADTSIVREKIIEWFDEQYSKGTPVTVWYVLSEPIEEDPPVPFPELPTLSGTNTITADTTVKPSEIDLTGRIKTSGYGQLLDKNLTAINDSTGTPIFIRG